MKLDRSSIAFLHAYPKLAKMSEMDRRDVLRRKTGCASAGDDGFFKHTFEAAMAAYETILWQRVEAGDVPDPRACSKCGRRMVRRQGGYGECPEGCEKRKVMAWEQRYWRRNITGPGMASSSQVNKIRELWAMLGDYLPADQRTDAYLHGIFEQAGGALADGLLRDGEIQWERLPATGAGMVIEALKDRLGRAIRN